MSIAEFYQLINRVIAVPMYIQSYVYDILSTIGSKKKYLYDFPQILKRSFKFHIEGIFSIINVLVNNLPHVLILKSNKKPYCLRFSQTFPVHRYRDYKVILWVLFYNRLRIPSLAV